MRNQSAQKGFTLIETLIYIALFAIIIGGGMVGAYRIIESTDSTNSKTIAEQESSFVIRKIDWMLNGASAVGVQDAGTRLNITNGTTSSFIIQGGKILLNGVQLTSDNITVNGSFAHTTQPDKPDKIKTVLVITSAYTQPQTFTNEKYLR